MSDDSDGCSLGCLPTILLVMLVWALVFGFTVNGKHHAISCSYERGVEVQ